jgi:hypothetical protein
MMFKDDYEAFCNVADNAANVRFQEMILSFIKTPDPLADCYFITIQVCSAKKIAFYLMLFQIGLKEEKSVLAKPLTAGLLCIKFPDVIDMQCTPKEGNVNIKLWCPMIGNKSKSYMLASSSFPLKSIAIGSHDKQILLKGDKLNATVSCRIVGEAADQIESLTSMQSRARYEASNKSKFALVKEPLLDNGGLLFTQFINTLDVRCVIVLFVGQSSCVTGTFQ